MIDSLKKQQFCTFSGGGWYEIGSKIGKMSFLGING